MFENKKILILGMARSGYEVARLLSKHNNKILITDMKEQDQQQVAELINLGVEYVITNTPEDLLDSTYDYVVKNPGIRKDHLCVLKARELGIKVINELEVAYDFIPKETKIIGITGSNGKTTTTTIIYELLKKANLPVHLGGNIGFPLSSVVKDIKKDDIIVIEISDHQLVDMYDFKTNISVLTNLSEVHLDFHGEYEIYKNTKKKIFNNHTINDLAIINKENKDCLDLTSDIPTRKIYFSSINDSDCFIKDNYIVYKNENVISIDDIKIKGRHNYENIMCAIIVVKEFNVSNEVIKDVLMNFNGVEHRIEFVRTYLDRDFYNDSKATNVESTVIALESFSKPTIILLGGLDRGHPFNELESHMSHVKLIVSYGETKNRISEWAKTINKECIVVDELTMAVKEAWENSEAGDVILLSPACASWDQYVCFEDRGNEFKDAVKAIKK